MTTNHDDNGDNALMPGNDPLDALLRDWHAENAASAAAQRDKLMNAVAAMKRSSASSADVDTKTQLREQSKSALHAATRQPGAAAAGLLAAPRSKFSRFTPAIAASLAFAATLGLLFSTVGPHAAQARGDVIMAPDGGRLDAVNARGELIGPCPLEHTDVHVDVSGSFARVTLQQRYGNPYADKIEAVYTFPMSHRAAVDRMTMTIGDRIVVGEVKEREAARATYEAAKSAGHAAALLEQERPNIFTQSVANIEPGVEIVVEISYVELLEARDGLFGFTFPMVVAPRYIPGGDDSSKRLPAGLQHREGLNLLAPGTLTITANGDTLNSGVLTADVINALLIDAVPIEAPPAEYWASHYPTNGQPAVWHQFDAGYMDGLHEAGVLYTDGLGQINGRWFYIDAGSAPKSAAGTGFANGTAQVPDAARITPQPVKPPTRAGHDISITVNIDTGGPGITDLKSELHTIQQNWGGMRTDGTPSQVAVSLNDVATIPNQDFVLHWRQTADTITEQVFTHAGAHGGFITLILNPPARVENTQAVPRELVFVLDTSGSMQGFPIQKAKEVMSKAIAALRPQDTFNLITFAGDTNILWDKPQPASPDKLAEAQQFLDSRDGRGGTEMMKAIEAALTVKPEQRQLTEGAPTPVRIVCFMTDGEVGNDMQIIDAVRKNAATTRVFSFGIGNSVNRYLLDGIARAGRGAAEYVLLNEGADEKVASFSQRIQSPVLMDVQMEFSGDIEVVDRVPEELPDLYDVAPIIVHARYTKGGKGSVTLRGNAGDGPYEKTLSLDLPETKAEHDVIATLWAREKVEQLMNRDLAAAQNGTFPEELKRQVIDLGETFQIMTQYTSFVAVDNLRVTVGGQPRLVPVPIEMPEGQSWEGTTGEAVNKWADEVAPDDLVLGRRLSGNGIPQLGDIPGIGGIFDGTQQGVADKLKQPTGEINLEGVSFEQAINQLRDQSGVNIVVNWSALETAAIEKDKEVSLHINAGTVSLGTALKLITEEVGGGEVELGSQVGDGVVQISTKEDLARRTTVETYNVEDLIPRMSGFQKNTTPDAATLTENSSSSEKDLVVYHLKHKTAYDIGFTIEDMLRPKSGEGPVFDVGPDEKTLIGKRVPPQKRDAVRNLIEMLDVPNDSTGIAEASNSSANDFVVYHLKHKTAYDIAFTLEDMLKPKEGAGSLFDEGPDEKTLIVKNFSPERRESVRRMIEIFDQPGDSSSEDGVVSLDAKDIPPEILARLAREIARQSKPDATNTDKAEIAAAGKKIEARERARLPEVATGTMGISAEAQKAIQQKLAGAPIDVSSTAPDSLVISATESDIREVEKALKELDAKAPESVDLTKLGGRVGGARWQGLHGEPPSDGAADHERIAREYGKLRQQFTNREGDEKLYFEGRRGEASNMEIPTTGDTLSKKGTDIFRVAGRKNDVAEGLPATIAGTPNQPQPPEALGREVRRSILKLEGMSPERARSLISSLNSGAAGQSPSAGSANVLPQGDAFGGAAAGETRMRVGYVSTPPLATPGAGGRPTNLGQAVLPSDPTAVMRLAGVQPIPMGQPGLIPQAGTAQGYSRGRDHVYKLHEEATAPLADAVSSFGLGVPLTQTGSGSDPTGNGQPEPLFGSAGGDRINIVAGAVADQNGDGQSDVPFAADTMDELEKKNRELQDFRATWSVLGQGTEPNEKLMTLESVATELELDALGKEALWEQLKNVTPEQNPNTPNQQALQARISQTQQDFLRAEEMLNKAKEQLTRAKAEQRDKDAKLAEYQRLVDERDALRARLNLSEWAGSTNHTNRSGQDVQYKDGHADFGNAGNSGTNGATKPPARANAQAELLAFDELVVRVAGLARAGRLHAAAMVVDELVKLRPDHAVSRAMHEVLNCFVITNESCIRQLIELAAPSAMRLQASADRARLMARRLDERLLRLAVGDASPEATAGLDMTDAGVLVSVLVDAFGDGTVAALTKSGLKVESTSKPTRVVIGRIAAKHLGDLATCKHVRRVEAVKIR